MYECARVHDLLFWFLFDLKIIFLFLLFFLCSRIWFGTRGSSCQAPLFCYFHATVVAGVLFGIGYKNTQGEILSFLCSPPLVVGLSLSWSWSHDYGGRSTFMATVPCLCLVRLLQSVRPWCCCYPLFVCSFVCLLGNYHAISSPPDANLAAYKVEMP